MQLVDLVADPQRCEHVMRHADKSHVDSAICSHLAQKFDSLARYALTMRKGLVLIDVGAGILFPIGGIAWGMAIWKSMQQRYFECERVKEDQNKK